MTTLLVTHPTSAHHETPRGHPERIERIVALESALAAPRFAKLKRLQAQPATPGDLARCHSPRYVERLQSLAPREDEGLVPVDEDTVMSPGTWDAGLHAVGGAMLAIDEIMEGKARNAFIAARPPGHHAEPERAMGFCFFNTAALAARHAQIMQNIKRVAIIDFDVHHGNGTQAIFWSDRSVLYASVHQMPLYPGTGAAHETGAAGTIVNAPLPAGAGSAEFRHAVMQKIIPRLDSFEPEFLIISAGFDAHKLDPLGGLELEEKDFSWVTLELMKVAERWAKQRVVSVLEGGYDLGALSRSAAAHVGALMGEPSVEET